LWAGIVEASLAKHYTATSHLLLGSLLYLSMDARGARVKTSSAKLGGGSVVVQRCETEGCWIWISLTHTLHRACQHVPIAPLPQHREAAPRCRTPPPTPGMDSGECSHNYRSWYWLAQSQLLELVLFGINCVMSPRNKSHRTIECLRGCGSSNAPTVQVVWQLPKQNERAPV
jgi:hypothetical protein